MEVTKKEHQIELILFQIFNNVLLVNRITLRSEEG